MAKNITIFTLLQNFISKVGLLAVLTELGFEDTTCKCDVTTLLDYLIGIATFEWRSLHYASDVVLGKRGEIRGLKRLDELNYLYLIVSRLNRAARCKLKLKKDLMAIDSTKITVGALSGELSGIKLHMSYTIRTAMPIQKVETTSLKHDGPVGMELEDNRFILVADRAYFSIKKADRYAKTGQDFVIRLKGNIQLNRKKTVTSRLEYYRRFQIQA